MGNAMDHHISGQTTYNQPIVTHKGNDMLTWNFDKDLTKVKET